jgi:hypothetical protein
MRRFVALAFVMLVSCGKSASPPPPSADQCTKSGEQCKLPNGPLGVCNMEPCKDGAAGPCFRCQPQH